MAEIHIGIASTLAAIPKADISNGDIAHIWLNSFKRTMVFDSTATDATDISNHPYYQRPDDYGAGPGVWIEDVGADQPEAWSANQIITGQLISTNWDASAGSEYDLDLAKFRLGGSNVNAAGTAPGIFLGLDSGVYKFYVGDGANKYFKFDATDFILNLTNLVISSANQTIKLGTGNNIISLDAADVTYRLAIGHATYGSAPFRVTKAGVLTATGANISGAITGSTIDIGGADATSFHVDVNGNMWLGATTYNIDTNPFAVSNAGLLRAVSGSIGGWTISQATFANSTHIILDASNKRINIKSATFGNDGIQLEYNSGNPRAYIGDGANVYWKFDGSHLTISVDANVGTGVGIIYKDNKRWLYDFNPAHNGTVQPDGFNLFLGIEAGNLAMGSTALVADQASYNIGIGYQSLYFDTTGFENIGIGYRALYANTTGYDNVGIGYQALYTNTTGSYNIGIGYRALYANTTNHRNIGIGYRALQANTTGYDNVGIGCRVLQANTTGYKNVGIGYQALHLCTVGFENIGIAFNAGSYQNDGSTPLLAAEGSIYIGHLAKSGSVPAGGEDVIVNEIVIGHDATGNGGYTITLGDTNITEFHCQVALTVDSDKRIKRNIIPNSEGLNFINALNPITFQKINPFDYPDKIKPAEYKDHIIKEIDSKGKEKTKFIKAKKRPPDNNKTYLGLIAQEVEKVMAAQRIDLQLVVTSNRGKKAITYGNLIMPLITAVQELAQKVEILERTLH